MKYVFWIGVVVALCAVGWRIVEPEVTNFIFQDEVQETAAEFSARAGFSSFQTDEGFRNIVIRKAAKHEIALDAKQVTVRSSGPPEHRIVYIAVNYTVPIDFLIFSYKRHFRFAVEVHQHPAYSPLVGDDGTALRHG